MLRDGRTTHCHALGDLGDGSPASEQARQHRPPGRVTQSIKHLRFVSIHLR
jgi:hypothetical protein